ncbi:MAG TPA: hypothetical protein VJ716_04555 [Gaiellaceae bacterium]|nr:hypothetical protein [Gaiellaceae bacterium]
MATDFNDRVAVLQEHIVGSGHQARTANDCLDVAEQCLADGNETRARVWLSFAWIRRALEELEEFTGEELEAEDEDDAC